MPPNRVLRKQENSRMCLVCGLKNPYGLKASFFETETHELIGLFTPGGPHQGYPGRLHGGMSTAILDETVGRAVNCGKQDMVWGVTLEFTVQFRKPVPLGAELRVAARIVSETRRTFEGTGEILLPDGSVAVTGRGKYLKLAVDKIADWNRDQEEWRVAPDPSDPEFIET